MNRRDTLLALLAIGVASAPLRVSAQAAPKLFRIGVLSHHVPREGFVALPAALRELGYEEGRNFVFDYRNAEGRDDRLPGLAAELVAKRADLILAITNSEILAAKGATSTIPIVMLFALAPVETGLVASLARPGGNVTGTTIQAPEQGGTLLEILHEAVPRVTRVTRMWEPEFPGMELYLREADRVAEALGIRLTMLPGRTLEELETAFARIARKRPDALYVIPTGAISAHRARVIEFAACQRLPAIYAMDQSVTEGGLMSYAADRTALMRRRTAAIIDRILKGAKPADIPMEQPTKFQLIINLKTAKQLGLKIPQSVLLRADKVIE